MRLKPNLFAKAMILVAFPLLCEVLFTGVLSTMVHRIDDLATREHQAREAMASLNSIYERLTESSKLVALIFTRNGNASVNSLHELTAPIPGDLSNLRKMLAHDQKAMESLDRLDRDLNASLRILDEVFSQVESGDRIGAIQRLRDLKHAIPDLTDQLNQLRSSCNLDAGYQFDQQRKERRSLVAVLGYMIAFNIVAAIAIGIFIHRNITRRLGVVIDNTHRLAQDKPLLPAVGGYDEIAHLDKVFKDMAIALEMAHKKERAVIDTMPAGLVITDATGHVQMANPTTIRLFRLEEQPIVGRPLSIFFKQDKPISNEEFMQQLFAKGKERVDESLALRADQSTFPVELSVTSFTVYGEEYHLVVLLDITERKEIERLKQEFVSMVSHDLRTPLTSIQVFLNMLCKGMLGDVNEKIEKKASMADRNATRLINLINDLLDVEKMESGQLALSCEDTSLQSVIERSVDSVKGFSEQQGVSVVADQSADNADVRVHADGDRLVQVMVNLLGNAVKFSPKGSTVRIMLVRQADEVCVNVIDQGRGVPEHLRSSIFERFKQVSTKDATEKKGTGLGLAICKAIVEQHGGTIGCDSEEGKGSTFWFRLPLLKAAVKQEDMQSTLV